MLVIDSTIVLLILRPGTLVPNGSDGSPVSRPKDRIDYLVQRLSKAKSKIIIPTPVLSEALVRTSFFRIDKAMSSLLFVASAGRFTGYDPG